MNRKLMRYTLIGLIVLAAIWAAVPEISKAFGLRAFWPALGTVSEHSVEAGPCVDEGVTLVVDYGQASKRATRTACAVSYGQLDTDTGWNLFAATQMTVEGTLDYPTGFVCRIAGFPDRRTQDCSHVPAANAGHWAYFIATDASGWHYAQVGAASSHPACGTWQGWRFIPMGETRIRPPRVAPETFSCHG